MDCRIERLRKLTPDELLKIKSYPIIVKLHGTIKEDSWDFGWKLGEYIIGSLDHFVTDEPSEPTRECVFDLPLLSDEWIVKLSTYIGMLREAAGNNVWLNPSIYESIPQVKVSNEPFPGSTCYEDFCFGLTPIDPLSIKTIEFKSKSVQRIDKPSLTGNNVNFVFSNELQWYKFTEGYLGIGKDEVSKILFFARNNILYLEGSLDRFSIKTKYYRPTVYWLHPYILVTSRFEENTCISSPLVSLYNDYLGYVSIVSTKSTKVCMSEGVIKIKRSEETPVIVTSSPPVASLKLLYTLLSPPIVLEGYSSRGATEEYVAHIRSGHVVFDKITFEEKGRLQVRLYNPGLEAGMVEFKFNTRIRSAELDGIPYDPLGNTVRIPVSKYFAGDLEISFKRSLIFTST